MRLNKVLKNSVISFFCYGITLVVALLVRKLLVSYMPLEYAGYESLFKDIFSMLSVAELGLNSIFIYRLYEAVAQNNNSESVKLLTIYKYIYRGLGCLIAVVGSFLVFLLPFIISSPVLDWGYVRFIYFIQLGTILATFFLSYRRAIFIADQNEYVCVQVDAAVQFSVQILKLLVIVLFRSYVGYLLIALLGNIMGNYMISRRAEKKYPFIKQKQSITRQDIAKRAIFKDIKSYCVNKIAFIAYNGMDNIIISTILGTVMVALFGNYMLIYMNINSLILKFSYSLKNSIGNLIYSESFKKVREIFFAVDLGYFFLASFTSISYLILLQPFIQMFFGPSFLLPYPFVVFLSIRSYLMWSEEGSYYFRFSFGHYEKDHVFMIMGSIINFCASIVAVKKWGISGIMFGTALGQLFISLARVRSFYKIYLKEPLLPHLVHKMLLFMLFLLEMLVCLLVTKRIDDSFFGFIIKISVCMVVPNIMNLLILHRAKPFHLLYGYAKGMILVVKNYVLNKLLHQ